MRAGQTPDGHSSTGWRQWSSARRRCKLDTRPAPTPPNIAVFIQRASQPIVLNMSSIHRLLIIQNGDIFLYNNLKLHGMIGIGTTATTNTSIDISGNITTSGIITRNGSGITNYIIVH